MGGNSSAQANPDPGAATPARPAAAWIREISLLSVALLGSWSALAGVDRSSAPPPMSMEAGDGDRRGGLDRAFSGMLEVARFDGGDSDSAPASKFLAQTNSGLLQLTNVTSLDVGDDFGCVLTTAGIVKCWGGNQYFQLGDGTSTTRLTPVDVVGLSPGVVSLSVGRFHACAISNGGGVSCWGRNSYGELGNGTSGTDTGVPQQVVGLASGVVAVAAADFHTCALLIGGAVKCWGNNLYGKLGNNSTTNSAVPVDVVGLSSGVAVIAAGALGTCSVMDSGGLKCWGSNQFGSVGDGSGVDRLTPVDVPGLTSGVATVSVGAGHVCATSTSGALKCWGNNGFGQVGDGSTSNRLVPVDVVGMGSTVTSVSAANGLTCAVANGTALSCWGHNSEGQLGDTTTTDRWVPVGVSGLASGVAGASGGTAHSCARIVDGRVKCWGNNSVGQLGDNTTAPHVSPAFVLYPAQSVTTVDSTPNPSVYSQPLQLTATVSFNGDGGTGSVDFRADGNVIGGCAAMPLSVSARSGTAQCTTNSLSRGSHLITVTYPGDGLFEGSVSAALAQTVNPPAIGLSPISLPGTFAGTAYSQQLSASGAGTTGPFQFAVTSGALPSGLALSASGALSGTTQSSGTFAFTVTATDSSPTSVGGPFSGLQSYSITVAKQPVSVTLASDGSPATVNTPVRLTASVSSSGYPAVPGTVDFRDGSTLISGCGGVALTGALNSRTAVCTVSNLALGTRSVTATYSGDAYNFSGSSSVLQQTIVAPAISFAPSSMPATLSGVSYAQTVTASGVGTTAPFTYTITAGSLPAGMTLLASGGLSGIATTPGVSAFSLTAIDSSSASVGGPFSASVSYSISVSLQSTSIAIGTISPEPSLTGQSYSVPVTVSGQSTTPNGVITCNDGSGASDTKALSAGSATCALTSTTSGTKTITVVYGAQGNFDASVNAKTHLVNDANQAPTLGFNPVSGSTVALAGSTTQLGDPASGQVTVSVTGVGSGTGNVSVGCSVSGGNLQLGSGGSQSLNVGAVPAPIVVSCARTSTTQSGNLSCTETSSPGGAQRQLNWPLVCPPASAVPPTLAYDPPPGNTVVFNSGASGTASNAVIQVTGSGAVGDGSANLTCSIPPTDTAFSIVGGNNQTVMASVGAVPLGLRCLLTPTQRTSTLTCVETDGPVVAQRTRTWPLNCPPGQAGTTAKLTVGSRTVTRGHVVSVPVSFAGEGTTTSVTAQISYDPSRLLNPRSIGAAGGGCTVVAASHAINVTIPNLGGALPANDTRYCDLQFSVPANAASGPSTLSIGQANCLDAFLVSKLCAKSDGRVAVAAVSTQPGEGAGIVIDGHVSDLDKSFAVRVSNDSNATRTINGCTFTSTNPNLRLSATPALPLTILPTQTGTLTLQCHLPPLGQQYAASLNCTTDDAMRAVLYYDVLCKAVADGAELSAEQLLNDQQRSGEQQGRSSALADVSGGTLVALGAPLGGSDGNGRVALYESAQTAGRGSDDGRPALRPLASLESPPERAGEHRGKAVAALVTDLLGQAVAIRGDGGEIAVGAPNAPSTGAAAGPGRVLRYLRPAGGWANFEPTFDLPQTIDAPSLPGITPAGFGSAVAYSGSGDLLVGAPGSTASNVSGAGAVFAYAFAGLCPESNIDPRNGSSCVAGASLFDPPVAASSPGAVGNGSFGAALALASSAVFVGAPGELVVPIKPGNVYRIDHVAGTFGATTRLAATSSLATNDRLGSALAITGNLLLAGAPGADNAAGSDAGAVLVFRNLAAPAQVGLLLPGTGASQSAGSAIAANASTIYVGAPAWSSAGHSGVGRVYAYPMKASFTMQESPTATLEDAGDRDGDDFGRSLALGPEQAIVGVPKADATLFDGTALTDTGRADPFALPRGDAMFSDGFE